MVQQQDWTNFSLQRPNYFPGQYLLDEDFELAHKYLSDRQRYVNSKLHLSGIVEGLEVELIATATIRSGTDIDGNEIITSEATVTIKSGTAIDGKGNLIILPEAKTHIKITSECWVCLKYHQEPKILQQPEIPDSFTRFEEDPLITLEAIQPQDTAVVTLAKITLDNGQVKIDNSVRQYSGVRLPSGKNEPIALQSDGQSLKINGNLSLSGVLKLGDRSTITSVSESIATESDRINVVPSEKAVKDHINKRIAERLAALNAPTQEKPAISLSSKADGLYGWSTEGGDAADISAVIKLLSYRAGVATPRLTIDRDTGNVGIGTTTPARKLDVNGAIRAGHLESTNPMRHRMYPNNPIVYQDIFDARDAGAIAKHRLLKNAPGDAETRHTATNLWNDRPMICYGGGDEDDAGAVVTVPEGYNTLWVRVTGQVWNVIKAQFLDGFKEDLGRWTAGNRHGNCYCPDGSLTDSYNEAHQWLPIPVGRSGQVTLISKTGIGGGTGEFWVSGLAFSKNPWAHATQSALGYHWKVNTGDATNWEDSKGRASSGWNWDIFTRIPEKTNLELMVPVVWSGRDKLLYMVEHGNDWNGCLHNGITVNGQPIERFLASYDNPFARHWNSKSFQRYIAAYIPADLISKPTANTTPHIKVKIDMSKQNGSLHFRELGTHDLEIPYSL